MAGTSGPETAPAPSAGAARSPKLQPTPPTSNRLRRLAEELAENGLPQDPDTRRRAILLQEVDRCLRPAVHERRAPSYGVIIDPGAAPDDWELGTQLDIARIPVEKAPGTAPWRFADGLSSWLVRRVAGRGEGGGDEWLLFDRPAGSERDLVVLVQSLDATIVQRHPSGAVRIVGHFGLLRWEGVTWHFEPPLRKWLEAVAAPPFVGDVAVVKALLDFAVHDLGALGIGALLVYRPVDGPSDRFEERLPLPPPLQIRKASHLAPLRHVLSQVDGAAIFDLTGALRRLGVRLVPSTTAEESVVAFGGTRHISGLRYSFDDPSATIVAVSEDGPVTVARTGSVVTRPSSR